MEVNMYVGFWTLKMKCTQYGTSNLQKCKGQARVGGPRL